MHDRRHLCPRRSRTEPDASIEGAGGCIAPALILWQAYFPPDGQLDLPPPEGCPVVLGHPPPFHCPRPPPLPASLGFSFIVFCFVCLFRDSNFRITASISHDWIASATRSTGNDRKAITVRRVAFGVARAGALLRRDGQERGCVHRHRSILPHSSIADAIRYHC